MVPALRADARSKDTSMLCSLLTLSLFASAPAVEPTSAVALAPSSSAPDGRRDRDDEAEADRLSNESGELWNAGDYDGAAKVLEQSLVLYGRVGGLHSDEARVLRALVYNYAWGGRHDDALGAFGRLLELPRGAALEQLDRALEGLSIRAENVEVEVARELHRRARKLLRREYPDRAARSLHLLALRERTAGEFERAHELLLDAIDERDEIGDLLGATWSRQVLAADLLEIGELDGAGALLVEAFDALHSGTAALATQEALTYSIEKFLRAVRRAERPARDQVEAVAELTAIALRSGRPSTVPAQHLVGELLDASARRRGRSAARGDRELVERQLHVLTADQRAEVELLLAADSIRGKDFDDARERLELLEPLGAPADLRRGAWRLTFLALAAAGAKDAVQFDRYALEAVEAWELLEVLRPDREEGLRQLAEAAKGVRGSAEAERVVELYTTLMRSGRPGGKGGSSHSLGQDDEVLARFAALGPDEVVFDVRVVDDAVVVSDRIAGTEERIALDWGPQVVRFNGCALLVCGGYVAVRALDYSGSNSGSAGLDGGWEWRDLGFVRPLPAGGALLVTKSGAVVHGALARD